jgi:hypothetical protein|eukprot:COSAG02_NODE_778_length_17288_cov_102.024725_19_plen_66_part_00
MTAHVAHDCELRDETMRCNPISQRAVEQPRYWRRCQQFARSDTVAVAWGAEEALLGMSIVNLILV